MGNGFERSNCSADDRLAAAQSLNESRAAGRQLIYLNLHSAADDQGVFAACCESTDAGSAPILHAPDGEGGKLRLRHA